MQVLERGFGAPLLMLHGFPDHAASWRPLGDLLGTGIRQLAPDQRGYRLTSRPTAIADYAINVLVDDLIGLLDALGLPTVHVCGHDWGGVLAFELALRCPQRVAGLIALNAPPASVLQEMIYRDPAQRAASQYVSRLRSNAADSMFREGAVDALIDRFLGDAAQRGLVNADDLAAYREAWTQPGAWQAMLAWYRAAPFIVPEVDAAAPAGQVDDAPVVSIACPVMVIWGERDGVFVPAMPDAIARVCRSCRIVRLPDAGHVPHRDAPEVCAALIRDFVLGTSIQSSTKVETHG
jgi:pimeloyl-ACP methyl ester carboxylesterase